MLPNWGNGCFWRAQLYALPDSEGVLVWFDAFGKAQAVVALEKAYSETAEMLHGKKVPLYLKAAASVRFIPALGSLHSVWLKAQAMREYGIRPPERVVSKPTAFSTVRFSPDEHGVLQARIVPLDNGSRAVRPYGLFIHKKAAKRALDSWALENRLCPDALNILPVANGKGVPCPVQAAGQCDGACRTENGIEAQNGRNPRIWRICCPLRIGGGRMRWRLRKRTAYPEKASLCVVPEERLLCRTAAGTLMTVCPRC